MWPNPQETVDLATFTEEILNGKLHSFCIVSIFVWNLPQGSSRKNFQYGGEIFTKDRIASKIKLFWNKCRNALDLEKKSGAGRTAATYYDICKEILSE